MHDSMSQFCSDDEMLLRFRGKCIFRQYIPSKPIKYGQKDFTLWDTKTFYTSNLEVYIGIQPEGLLRVSNSPLPVVERIYEPILGTRRNVTTNNWFTSAELS